MDLTGCTVENGAREVVRPKSSTGRDLLGEAKGPSRRRSCLPDSPPFDFGWKPLETVGHRRCFLRFLEACLRAFFPLVVLRHVCVCVRQVTVFSMELRQRKWGSKHCSWSVGPVVKQDSCNSPRRAVCSQDSHPFEVSRDKNLIANGGKPTETGSGNVVLSCTQRVVCV